MLQSSLSSQITGLKNQNLSAINSQESEVKAHFNSVKQSIDQNYAGGVKSLEQMKGDKIENLLGYNDIADKFNSIRQNVTQKFNQE